MSADQRAQTRSASNATCADVRLRRAGEAPRELENACRCCPDARIREKRGYKPSTRGDASLPQRGGNAARLGINDAHQAQFWRMRLYIIPALRSQLPNASLIVL